MKYQKPLSKILLVIVIVCIGLGSYMQVRAQQSVLAYLDERFKQKNIPVKEIRITQKLPLRLEIIIQSAGDGTLGAPEDPINYHLVEREIVLARQQGFFIESFTRVFINNQGQQIAASNTHIKLFEYMFLDTPSARISDSSAKTIVVEKANLYGMSATNIEIKPLDEVQALNMQLTTPSLEEVNKVLPQFMLSLRPLINDVNQNGASIAVCRLEIRDEKGNMLLNYMLDLQIDSENWWMADGLTMGWFPHPGPAPVERNEQIMTPTSVASPTP